MQPLNNLQKAPKIGIWILFLLASYSYLTSFVVSFSSATTEYALRISNPFAIILSGRDNLGDGMQGYYNQFSQLLFLKGTLLQGAMIVGLVRYFWSKGIKDTLLRFAFAVIQWQAIANISMIVFRKITGTFQPFPVIPHLKFYQLSFYAVLPLTLIISTYVLYSLQKNQQREEEDSQNSGSNIVIRWSRTAHFFTDRLIAFAACSVYFFSEFYERKYHSQFSTSDVNESQLLNWGIVSFVVILTICYLFSESILGTSPGKILTGTSVIDSNSRRKPSFVKVLIRTFSRLIPLEAFSFFSGTGLHDRISGTGIAYTSKEPWLKTQTKLISGALVTIIVAVLWLLIAVSCNFISRHLLSFDLPLLLVSVGIPIVIVFAASYLASLHNFTDNAVHGVLYDDREYFTGALACFIPLYNFVSIRQTFLQLESNFEALIKDDALVTEIKDRTHRFCTVFPIFYTLFWMGAGLYFVIGSGILSGIFLWLGTVSLLISCIDLLSYVKTLNRLLSPVADVIPLPEDAKHLDTSEHQAF